MIMIGYTEVRIRAVGRLDEPLVFLEVIRALLEQPSVSCVEN